LSAEQREVVLLFAWADLSYEEIAEALAIPLGTVRSRLARARAHLRAGLVADAVSPKGGEAP
jgi:RNA polymerase sigma-70 factor (ECF subfamily)